MRAPHAPPLQNMRLLLPVLHRTSHAPPLAPLPRPRAQSQARHKLSFCGRNGTLAVVPHKGDALLFFDLLPDGRNVCRKSLHASCPTLRGTKWTATK